MGEACSRKGSAAVLETMQEVHEHDSHVRVITTECVGCCGSAPAALFDRKLATRLNPIAALQRVEQWVEREA